MPPQKIMVFEGADASSDETLRLTFNQTKKKATLVSIDRKGKVSEIGKANCAETKRRNIEE